MAWKRANKVLTPQYIHADSAFRLPHMSHRQCWVIYCSIAAYLTMITPVAWVTALEAVGHVSFDLPPVFLEDMFFKRLQNLLIMIIDLALRVAIKELLLILP